MRVWLAGSTIMPCVLAMSLGHTSDQRKKAQEGTLSVWEFGTARETIVFSLFDGEGPLSVRPEMGNTTLQDIMTDPEKLLADS